MVMITNDISERRASQGELKTVSVRKEGVADSGTVTLVISASSNGDLAKAVVGVVEVASTGDGLLDFDKNVTIDTSGSSVTVSDLLVDGNTPSTDLSAEEGGTYSGGTNAGRTVIPGGQKTAGSGSISSNPLFVLKPGNNVRIRVQNVSGGTQDISIRALVAEKSEA